MRKEKKKKNSSLCQMQASPPYLTDLPTSCVDGLLVMLLLTVFPFSSDVLCHTPDTTFTCFFSNCTTLSPAHHPYRFLPSIIMLSAYRVPPDFFRLPVPFHRVFSMALCMHTFRSCPLSFHLDIEKKTAYHFSLEN